MKNLVVISFLSLVVFIGCEQKESQEDIFKNVPMTSTIRFIDSIQHKIRLDAGNNFTARPVLKEKEFYYDERNFRDSLGNLREYSIIERWDTGDVFTNYFYYQNQLINVSKSIFTLHVSQTSNYYFRKDALFGRYVEGPLTLMSTDTLLRRGYSYLSIKGDVGDTAYRKYFGKNSNPPSSMVDLVQ
jgi:hypothetical protein